MHAVAGTVLSAAAFGISVVAVNYGYAQPAPVVANTGDSNKQPETPPTRPDFVDFEKPIFTKWWAPMCRTKEGLADLLEHVRAGVHVDVLDFANYGCTPARGGMKVEVLDTSGVFDMWARAYIEWPSGQKEDDWTVVNLLQN